MNAADRLRFLPLFRHIFSLPMLLILAGQGCGESTPPTSEEPGIDLLEGERINRFYTNEEIRYFLEIAIGDTSAGAIFSNLSWIRKWTSDVRIDTQGEMTTEDSLILRETVEELNTLISPISITLDEHLPTLNIRFFNSGNDEGLWYLSFNWNSDYSFHNLTLEIYAPPGSLSRTYAVRGGVAAAMGLYHRSLRYSHSIFYDGPHSNYDYASIDRTIIRILYSPEVLPGKGWEETILALKNR